MFAFKGEQLFVYFGGHGRKCTIFDHVEQAEYVKRRRFGKRRSLEERSALDLDPSSFANLLRQGYGGREATADEAPRNVSA